MRKPPLFALGMCAAALWGQVSLALGKQVQSSAARTSDPQNAPQTYQTGKASTQKAQATQQSPQAGKLASGAKAQVARALAIPPGYRLLNLKEGRAIVQEMSWVDDEEGLAPDCSHLVHKLYEQAGYTYPYASSLDLYRGTGPFLRVRYAHPGDLVVWRGHVGIVVKPQEHSFFSTTSSGTRIENYRSGYWRTRGYPHFFRYLTKGPLKNGGASEASNRTPALQPAASQSHASKSPSAQAALKPKDPQQH